MRPNSRTTPASGKPGEPTRRATKPGCRTRSNRTASGRTVSATKDSTRSKSRRCWRSPRRAEQHQGREFVMAQMAAVVEEQGGKRTEETALITGSEAIAVACKLADVDVITAY